MFKRLFPRGRAAPADVPMVRGQPPRMPQGVRVYVIGDIHGRLDLLTAIEQQIVEDTRATGGGLQSFVVYLGDYVDRGFESRKVIEHLAQEPLPGFTSVYLLGNHDVWLRDFVSGEQVGDSWLRFGGDATLFSYGVKLDLQKPEPERFKLAQAALQERLPPHHLAFLNRLELAFGFGDYFFCHAGIRPDVPLDQQVEPDLCWIREPFLSWNGDVGKIIVHGHTVEDRPVVRSNRIGIDTGACWTNTLTCLVLEGTERRFLQTGAGRPAGANGSAGSP